MSPSAGRVRVHRGAVSLDCELPSLPRLLPTENKDALRVRFAAPAAEATFTHAQIVEHLLPQHGPEPMDRPFVMGAGPHGRRAVHLGDMVELPEDTLADLCAALDELRPSYAGAYRHVEQHVWRSARFDRARGGVHLGTVNALLWEHVTQFAAAKGATSPDAMIVDGDVLRIGGEGASSVTGCKAALRGERAPSSGLVRVVWLAPEASAQDSDHDFARGALWDAERTFAWLTVGLIPSVLQGAQREKSLWERLEEAASFNRVVDAVATLTGAKAGATA